MAASWWMPVAQLRVMRALEKGMGYVATLKPTRTGGRLAANVPRRCVRCAIRDSSRLKHALMDVSRMMFALRLQGKMSLITTVTGRLIKWLNHKCS